MRRLLEMVKHGRVDLTPMITHCYSLDHIAEAYRIFGERTGYEDRYQAINRAGQPKRNHE
jgi:threonine dehydrogenase-like Zn-dependent dehydrogenase